MKALIFVDMHGSLDALEKIKEKGKNVDMIICAGDISIFEADLDYLVMELSKIGKDIIMVHGNHEDEKNLRKVCDRYDNIHFLHKEKKKVGDVLFIGYGGGGFSFDDPELEEASSKMEKWIKKHDRGKVVVVVHGPPYGTTVDKLKRGHVGNISLREFIVKNKLDVVVCGHLHGNAGKKDKIEGTDIINPGPEGQIIEI